MGLIITGNHRNIERSDLTYSICIQCGYHLENSFRFCPKCGMQLIISKEVDGLGGGGNSQIRSRNVSNVSQTHLLQSKVMATPVPLASSSPCNFQTSFKLPGFKAYKASKEKERRGFDIRGKEKKRHIEAQSVVILVGIWELTRNQSDARLCRKRADHCNA